MEDHVLIMNAIYGFAERFDAGALAEALELFSGGQFLLGGERRLSASEMGQLWKDILILHDGRPLTRHVITNPIIEIDETKETARVRSVYTVFQETPQLPFQPIMGGRYHDRLRRSGDTWRFVERDYRLVDFVGDVSQHLKPEMANALRPRT